MRFNQGGGIGRITVDRRFLAQVLRDNREKHHAEFLKAVEGFRAKAVKELNRLADEIRDGKIPRTLALGLPIPEEHTADYDRAIRMLEIHQGETIELEEDAYSRLVDDDWGWKEAFSGTNAYYVNGGN